MNNTPELIISILLGVITLIYLLFFIKNSFLKKKKIQHSNMPKEAVFLDVAQSLIFETSGIEIITTTHLKENNNKFMRVVYQIQKGLDLAQNNPYLINEIISYLRKNMMQNSQKVVDYLIPLFNYLAESDNVIFGHFIGNLFYTLRIEGNIDKEGYIITLRNEGSIKLIESLIEYDVKSNNSLSKDNLDLILKLTIDKENTALVRKYADYLAEVYRNDEQKVILLLENVIPKINLLNIKNIKSHENQHLINFLTKLIVKIFVDSSGNFDRMSGLLNLLNTKYSFIIDAIFDIETNNPIKKRIYSEIKKNIYKNLEESGINQWNQAIGNIYTGRELNNYFFVKYKFDQLNINQRDVLFEYLPFLVLLYNKKYDDLSFSNDCEFYTLSLKMINFAPFSIVGYISVLGLVDYIVHSYKSNPKLLQNIVESIYSDKSSSKFFLYVLLDNLLMVSGKDDRFYKEVLQLSNEFVISDILNGKLNANVFYFLDNKSVDIEIGWFTYKEILDSVVKKANATNINNISSQISYCAYLPDIRVGKKLAIFFLETEIYKKQIWQEAFINLTSALYSRDSNFVRQLIVDYKVDEKFFNEWSLLNHTHKDSAEVREARSYQTNWNEFLINGLLNDQRLKFHIVRDLIGGLTQSNSVVEFSKEFRRYVLETLRTFLFESFNESKELTLQEIINLAESKKTSEGIVHEFNKNVK